MYMGVIIFLVVGQVFAIGVHTKTLLETCKKTDDKGAVCQDLAQSSFRPATKSAADSERIASKD
jgi:hypothetical protein